MSTDREEQILLIEDEEAVRKVGVEVLQDAGYQILEAWNAAQARELFHRECGELDLVISDVVLPDKSGVELIMEFKEQNPNLKVLLNSGYTSDRSNLEKIQKEGLRFLQKPYSVESLLKTVREIIDEEYNLS
jgi:two-component system cell cycle sensor histidine kinase/response regulator CckA